MSAQRSFVPNIERLETRDLLTTATLDATLPALDTLQSTVREMMDANMERTPVTPSFSVEGAVGEAFVKLRYEHMPAGLQWHLIPLGDTAGGTITEADIAPGGGTLLIHMPFDSSKAAELVLFDTSTRQRIGPRIPFTFGNHRIVSTPQADGVTLPSFTHAGDTPDAGGMTWLSERGTTGSITIPTRSLRTESTRDGDVIVMTTTDMPTGFVLDVIPANQPDNGFVARSAILPGTSETRVLMPRAAAGFQAVMRDPVTGRIVGESISFTQNEWSIRNFTARTNEALPEIAYGQEQPKPEAIIATAPETPMIIEISKTATVSSSTSSSAMLFDDALTSPETISLTPSFFLTAEPGDEFVALHYTDMPEGIRWDLIAAGTKSGSISETLIPAGSGTLLMHMPGDSGKSAELVFTKMASNERIGPCIPFSFSRSLVTQAPPNAQYTLPTLAHDSTPPEPMGLAWITAQKDNTGPLVTPQFSLLKTPNHLTIEFADMPQGMELALVVPGQATGAALSAIMLPAGSGSVEFPVPRANCNAAFVLRDAATGQEIGERTPAYLSEWAITSSLSDAPHILPSLQFKKFVPPPPKYSFTELSNAGIRQSFGGLIMEKAHLTILTSPRDLAAVAYPQFFGPGQDENGPTQRDIMRGAEEARNLANDALGHAAFQAFEESVRRRAGEQLGPSYVGRALQDAIGAFARQVYDYVRPMPSAEQIVQTVEAHFDELYRCYRQFLGDDSGNTITPAVTTAPVDTGISDAAYQRTITTIVDAHRSDPDGGGSLLLSYANSVGRSFSMEQIAALTGKTIAMIQTAVQTATQGTITTASNSIPAATGTITEDGDTLLYTEDMSQGSLRLTRMAGGTYVFTETTVAIASLTAPAPFAPFTLSAAELRSFGQWINGAVSSVSASLEAFYRGLTPALQRGITALVPKMAGSYSTNPDLDLQRQEDQILSILASSPPFQQSAGNWKVVLGSGAHDKKNTFSAFHAIDINLPGDADRDSLVFAVTNGTISKIDLQYGTIVIDHPATDHYPAWQSVYLHMPIVEKIIQDETGEIVRTEYGFQKSDDTEYGTTNANGIFTPLRLTVDMDVNQGATLGIMAGRGPRSDGGDIDTTFHTHLHYEARLSTQSINLITMARSAWGLNVVADDGSDIEHGPLLWSTTQDSGLDIGDQGGALLYREMNLIFFRDPAITNDSQTDYWVAWETDPATGKPLTAVSEMTRVVWKSVMYEGETKASFRWVDATNDALEWKQDANGNWSFASRKVIL